MNCLLFELLVLNQLTDPTSGRTFFLSLDDTAVAVEVASAKGLSAFPVLKFVDMRRAKASAKMFCVDEAQLMIAQRAEFSSDRYVGPRP